MRDATTGELIRAKHVTATGPLSIGPDDPLTEIATVTDAGHPPVV